MNLFLNDEMEFVPFREDSGQCRYYLRNRNNVAVFAVGSVQKNILSLFDGRRTIDNVRDALAQEGTEIPADQLSEFVARATDYGILVNRYSAGGLRRSWYQRSWYQKWFFWKALSFHIPKGIDHFVTRRQTRIRTIVRWISWVAMPIALVLSGALAVTASGAMIAAVGRLECPISLLSVVLGLSYFAGAFLHETGHWLSYKAYGGTLTETGMAFISFFPALYVNVDDAKFFPTKEGRALTWLGGPIADILQLSGHLTVFALFSEWEYSGLLVLSGLLCTFRLVFNLNPLFTRSDGYYIMCELLGVRGIATKGAGALIYQISFGRRCAEYKDVSLPYVVYALAHTAFMGGLAWLLLSQVF